MTQPRELRVRRDDLKAWGEGRRDEVLTRAERPRPAEPAAWLLDAARRELLDAEDRLAALDGFAGRSDRAAFADERRELRADVLMMRELIARGPVTWAELDDARAAAAERNRQRFQAEETTKHEDREDDDEEEEDLYSPSPPIFDAA